MRAGLCRLPQHALEQVRNVRQQNPDILALCLDRTIGADYVENYWRENLEVVKAGVYISRIFVHDVATRQHARAVAADQSRAGIDAWLIDRDDLEKRLKTTYNTEYTSNLFGFTVVRGVKTLEQVVLHAGVGEHVQAAAFKNSLLVDYFSRMHGHIRNICIRARDERGSRMLDPSRLPIQLQAHGRTLDAVRVDYAGSSSMSVALHSRLPKGISLERDEKVIVSSIAIGMAPKPMRVSHVHNVDAIVCRRREHKNCLTSRDGDYFIGLCDAA